MQRFDCLALDCPLFGPHLLEASAGTGKTFAIEHIVARLIFEGITLEQILVVTFTKAATRELKMRIRSNLEQALAFVEKGELKWPYLAPYLNSQEAKYRLQDALSAFDRCQIFTIHGFCHRMLKEFAFEANVGSLSDVEDLQNSKLKTAALDFLQNGISSDLLCSEQINQLFKDFETIDALVNRLVKLEDPEPSPSFSELFAKCKAAIQNPKDGASSGTPEFKCKAALHLVDEAKLLEDFFALQVDCKAKAGDFEKQVKALAHFDDPKSLGIFFGEKGSLFAFLSPKNRKVKQKNLPLHYPGFFEKAAELLVPILETDALAVLENAWHPIGKKVVEEEVNHDEILNKMQKGVQDGAFATCVREKYRGALIDEFQDTDAVQWNIFETLFVNEPIKCLYLVGDPKQSIYRFRKADIYTYLKARDVLGLENLYHLDTNFRSSKKLLGALNALFKRGWMTLPKTGQSLDYISVQAGAKIESDFGDEKGAVHFWVSENEEDLYPRVAHEIETLQLKNVAILVKDRYKAEAVLECLRSCGIQAVAKSHTPLGKTSSFQAIRELFHGVKNPRDVSLATAIALGPFGGFDLFQLKMILEEEGLVPFARLVLKGADTDAVEIFERLFVWEKQEGFSFLGLESFFTKYKTLTAEDGEGRQVQIDAEAVQIMTLHISKGLEFDVVFALGCATKTQESQEVQESAAEKLRQLYVAMTRAKKRLYVPILESKKEMEVATASPMELFSRHFNGPLLDELATLSKSESITIEKIEKIELSPKVMKKEAEEILALQPRPYTQKLLASFTTLSRPKEVDHKIIEMDPNLFTLQTMPRGALTGILLHSLFEAIFSETPCHKDSAAIDILIDEQLKRSPLNPWKEAIRKMVHTVLTMPLDRGFSLQDIEAFQTEMEFVFSSSPHLIKGFVDLVFSYQGQIYFLDWKSNWLENYTPESMQEAFDAHDYGLQAELYSEALHRHVDTPIGGAFYVFLRGESHLHIQPKRYV